MLFNSKTEEMEDKLSAAIKPYLKYYDFADTDEKVFALTGMYVEDISGFHPGDVEDGCTFIGHLIAKNMKNTTLETLLVFKESGRYIVGSTIGDMVIPISLRDASS